MSLYAGEVQCWKLSRFLLFWEGGLLSRIFLGLKTYVYGFMLGKRGYQAWSLEPQVQVQKYSSFQILQLAELISLCLR